MDSSYVLFRKNDFTYVQSWNALGIEDYGKESLIERSKNQLNLCRADYLRPAGLQEGSDVLPLAKKGTSIPLDPVLSLLFHHFLGPFQEPI